jgi:hypothetical protein
MKTTHSSHLSFFEFFGWIGVVLVLMSYILLSLDVIDSNNVIYHFLVLFGSILVGIISYKKRTFQPLVLNIVFATFAVIALARIVFF